MNYYLVNGEFEIRANNLESAYEQANALGLVIEEIEDITGFYEDMHDDLYEPDYDGQPDEAQEWYDFDPDC